MKVPAIVVIGNKEVESGELNPRWRSDLLKEEKVYKVDDLLQRLVEASRSRSAKV